MVSHSTGKSDLQIKLIFASVISFKKKSHRQASVRWLWNSLERETTEKWRTSEVSEALGTLWSGYWRWLTRLRVESHASDMDVGFKRTPVSARNRVPSLFTYWKPWEIALERYTVKSHASRDYWINILLQGILLRHSHVCRGNLNNGKRALFSVSLVSVLIPLYRPNFEDKNRCHQQERKKRRD